MCLAPRLFALGGWAVLELRALYARFFIAIMIDSLISLGFTDIYGKCK